MIRIFNHIGFQRYLTNLSWLYSEHIIRLSIGLIIGVWIARYLGPDQFGLFNYVQSIVCIFLSIATFGLNDIIVRDLVQNVSQQEILLGTAFVIRIVGSSLLIIVLSIFIFCISKDHLSNILVIIIAGSSIFQSFQVIEFFFKSKVLSKYVVFANMISYSISNFVKICLIVNKASIIAFACVILFDSITLSCGLIYFYKVNGHQITKWKFDKHIAMRILNDSWPLIISSLVLMIHTRIDQVMLKQMIGNKEVGYYSVALRIIELFSFIPMMLGASITPAIVNLKNNNSLYTFRLLNYYRVSFIMFMLTGFPIFLYSEHIILLLFGNNYLQAGTLLAFFSTRLFFTNFGVARNAYILTENLFLYSLLTMVIGCFVNIVLNTLLIPTYSGLGAIFSTIISFTVTLFIIDLVNPKTRKNALLMLKGIITFYKIKIFNDL